MVTPLVHRGSIVDLHKRGLSVSGISKKLQMSRSTVYKAIHRFSETGTLSDRFRSGRPTTVTTPTMIKTISESLSNKVCARPHSSVEALKKTLLEEWEKLPDEYLHATVEAYPRRLRDDKHVEETTVTLSTLKKERRRSWKTASNNLDNGGPDDDDTEALSVSSYLSATSKGMSSTKSCESVNDTKSMVTAFSGSICEEERAITPTENESEYILALKEEISQLRDINHSLKEEKAQWALRQRLQNAEQSESSLINMLEERLNQAENQIQDYRDENTVLKCELRELQETTFATSDEKLREKIRTTETLCDELMEENETLKAEVKDLQQEIEEMQDQYREEEIEEFRELQRELELNAKNCRVLQFKLRKTERSRDQAEAEKMHSEKKLEEYMNSCPEAVAASIKSDSAKVKELEYEIRVAKEVSVRLHNELEQTEEKRCKLEDEVFYLKEKVREIQTQNKWREARNKTDMAVKRLSAEIAASVPNIPENEMSKELRDALEREIDLREQMRFSEEDLKRTQIRMQDLENENDELLKKLYKSSKLRPPMIRSASDGNAHLQLELAESQVQHLNTKVERLEKTNDHLNKKIVELETDCKRGGPTLVHSKAGEFKLTPEMEKDMSKMIATISELERKNLELATQVKQLETKTLKPNFVVPSGTTTTELRKEQEKRKALEAQVNELKTTVFKSDNQKVISLATKIEQLNGQLELVNERCSTLHKKQVKDGESQYSDDLKRRIEDLEKQLSEKKATDAVGELQGKVPTTDEIEQCCEVLAAVETQTGRLCKQFEKIDHAQKDERRRSLSKDSGAAIIAELANVMQEMKNVHQKLDNIKSVTPGSTVKKLPSKESLPEVKCPKCDQFQQNIDEQTNEISFYKKKNKDLTNQVLQTEDRWTIEIEKQRQIFEKEIKTLGIRTADAKRQNDELSELLESKSTTLIEKTRSLEEQEERNKKLRAEVELLKKDMQEMETDKKTVKEFEIKYKKLESIFEAERDKMNLERSRSKNELTAMKKMKDDAEEHLKKLTEDQKKSEAAWKHDKVKLEKEIATLKKQLPEEYELKESTATPQNSFSGEQSPLRRQDSEKMLVLELKKQISILEKRIADANASLDDCRIQNAELKDQLSKVNTGWEKDKESFQHKTRKSEKLRTVEIDAMQQKFSSRMRIMEDTNKALHSQLVLARRERDTNKEALTNFEKQVSDERNSLKAKEKTASESTERVKELKTHIYHV
uniref:Paired domain-containing protein n=1 Tax=Caenorhabditis japonica TaxID=281687 RepID=A0A8R1DGW9_CAEJA